MASDSLGTMTVGVTANVSDAERALNSLANMLEKFDRQQQTRARGARSLTWENSGVFGAMNPKAGVGGLSTDDMAASANRARFAVMNLAYGVQDFAQTIGTGGFPAAIRASANNLTGLAVLFDKTAYASGGLKAALMTPEVAVIAVATAALFAADAIEKYQKSLQKAAAENAKAQFAKFDVAEAGQIGERQARFKEDLAQAKNLADAQKMLEQKQRDDRVAAERENREKTTAQQTRDMLEAEKKVLALRERLKKEGITQPLDATGMGPAAQAFAKEQAAALNANELELRAKIAEGTAKVKEAEEAINKTVGERIQLLKELDAAERNLRRAKRDDVEERFNRAFAENVREGQRQEEERIRIGRRDFAESVRKMESDLMELERKARFDPFANTAAAGRNTAAEYEALVRARAPGNMEANDLSAMKQLLQEQKEILRKIEENTKETYEGPPPTVDELINGV